MLNIQSLKLNFNKVQKLFCERGAISGSKAAKVVAKGLKKSVKNKTLLKRNIILRKYDIDDIKRQVESFLSCGAFRTVREIKNDIGSMPSNNSEIIIESANKILKNEFVIYDNLKIKYKNDNFSWRIDPLTDFEWPKDCGSFFIGDNKPQGTDVKTIWEIARFQFLSIIAYAYLLTGKEQYASYAIEKVQSWIEENKFLTGPHWLMPMESSIRLINWCVYLPLLDLMKNSDRLFINELTRSILEHLIFIRENLEYSIFRENNHYLSNIVGLIPARLLFPSVPWAVDCTHFAVKEFSQEIQYQFDDSGMNFEGSLSYHRLSSEMCLVGIVFIKKIGMQVPIEVAERLEQIKTFTEFYNNVSEQIPVIGDNDSGIFLELFPGQASNRHGYLSYLFKALLENQCKPHNYNEFLSSINFAKTPLPDDFSSQRKNSYNNSGLKTQNFDGLIIGIDGNEGLFFNTLQSSQGHTHNDKLSVYPVFDKNLLFIDRGTYSYSGYTKKRHEDRISTSHNGPVINGWEQNRVWEKDLFYISRDATCNSAINISGKTIKITGWHTGYRRYRPGMKVFRKVEWDTIERTMAITDWVESFSSNEKYSFSWNFLINPQWTMRKENNIFTFTNEGQKVFFKDADKVGLVSVQGRYCPKYQQELPCSALTGTCIAEAGERIHFVLCY